MMFRICSVVFMVGGLSLMAPARAQSASGWPGLEGRIGPYSGVHTVADVDRMISLGFRITIYPSINPAIISRLEGEGGTYLDSYLWSNVIHPICQKQLKEGPVHGGQASCRLSPEDIAAATEKIRSHLEQVKSDRGLAGFWILDDYPHGDVTPILRVIRQLVSQSNAETGLRRPTVCGVGGNLDAKRTPRDPRFRPDRAYTDAALTNVSPEFCDLVSPYLYGVLETDEPGLVDWSMRDQLPAFVSQLREKGFDTSRPLLVPCIQAFSHTRPGKARHVVKPRPADIEAQMRAYCREKPVAMLFFTWLAKDVEATPATDDSLLQGVLAGARACGYKLTP